MRQFDFTMPLLKRNDVAGEEEPVQRRPQRLSRKRRGVARLVRPHRPEWVMAGISALMFASGLSLSYYCLSDLQVGDPPAFSATASAAVYEARPIPLEERGEQAAIARTANNAASLPAEADRRSAETEQPSNENASGSRFAANPTAATDLPKFVLPDPMQMGGPTYAAATALSGSSSAEASSLPTTGAEGTFAVVPEPPVLPATALVMAAALLYRAFRRRAVASPV